MAVGIWARPDIEAVRLVKFNRAVKEAFKHIFFYKIGTYFTIYQGINAVDPIFNTQLQTFFAL